MSLITPALLSSPLLKREIPPQQKLLSKDLTRSTLSAALPPPPRFEMSKPHLTPPHFRLLQQMEKLKKKEEAAKKTLSSDIWSLLKKIGVCVLSATSAVLGISLVATAGG